MKVADAKEIKNLEPTAETIVTLPMGLLGFERIKKYQLIADPNEAPFQWLQVDNDENLAFLVVSPFEVLSTYQPEISDDDAGFLKLAGSEDAVIYNIVTLRPKGLTTVNLKGPIVLNRHTLVGKQVVIVNAAAYSVQHPIPTLS